jgi:hypothetical protein
MIRDPSRHGLVIVEGIMGSGKSSTMRFVAERLQDAGRRALAIHERTDPHPVRATDELEHWFQPWLDATPVQLAERSVHKWRSFALATLAGDAVAVMDGQLFHGDFTHLFLMDASASELSDHTRRIAEAVAPLSPLVVYFRQEDVAQAIERVCMERGADWVKYQVDWKLAAPYCTRRGYSGFEGLVALYRDYRRWTDELFTGLALPKLAIENSSQDWPTYQRLILQSLG